MSTLQSKNPVDQIEGNDYIHTFRSVIEIFSRQECNQIIELSKTLSQSESKVGDEKVNLYMRSSKVKWMGVTPDTKWIFERIQDAISYVNQFYKFDILVCADLQVTEYPVGGHFNWHKDVGMGKTSKRKLSLTVQLSDPAEYNGGDLEFFNAPQHDVVRQECRQQGTAIIFPSFAVHQVTIVTKGTRWSLIAWIYGPPFR